MQPVRIVANITESHKLVLDVPEEVPAGLAELLILPLQQPRTRRQRTMCAFLDDLPLRLLRSRSKDEIDAELNNEREAWD